MKNLFKIIPAVLFIFISIFSQAQIPEEIQWNQLEKVYVKDSIIMTLKLNNKPLQGNYKIPFEEGGYALYKIKDGKINGDVFWYSNSNNLEAKLAYKNGVRFGLKENYDSKGEVWLRQNYKYGRLNGKSEMLSSGKITSETYYINGKKDATQKSFSNGKLLAETNYKEGLRDGPSKNYSTDGSLISEINYKNDLQDGMTTMYANGQKTMDFNFKDGKKNGIGHMYGPEGAIVFTHYYLQGEKVTQVQFEKGK